jgi:ABC-type branched-subunit amino acid transport system ATPase component
LKSGPVGRLRRHDRPRRRLDRGRRRRDGHRPGRQRRRQDDAAAGDLRAGAAARGAIRFDGEPIDRLPAHERIARGLVLVPEGRMVFPFLSVEDNLRLGAFTPKARAEAEASLERVYAMFPRLPERRRQMAGSLSGGEQQMLALGRGLMSLPRLLMLDEPSLGLAPILVQEVMQQVAAIRTEGVTVLIVEQNVHQTLKLADRGYVLENGRLTLQGSAPSSPPRTRCAAPISGCRLRVGTGLRTAHPPRDGRSAARRAARFGRLSDWDSRGRRPARSAAPRARSGACSRSCSGSPHRRSGRPSPACPSPPRRWPRSR